MKQSSLPVVVSSLILVGCGGGGDGITVLDLEVIVEQDLVWLHAYEPEAPFECNQKTWLEPGGCDEISDAFTCSTPAHGRCIESLRIEEDDAVIGTGFYDADFQDGSIEVIGAAARDLVLVVTGCGGEAHIPLAANPLPVPAIVDVSTGGPEIIVQWSADDDTATGVVGWGGGFGGRRCHVERGQTVSLPAPDPNPGFLVVYVRALTEAVEHGTGLGLARVRSGGWVSEDLTQ